MIIATVAFFITNYVVGTILGGIFGNSAAMYTILTIGILAAIALWFVPNTKQYALGIAGVLIVAYVAVEVLAPYQVVLTALIAAALAVVVLVQVKRPMLRYLRNGNGRNLPAWARVCLTLL